MTKIYNWKEKIDEKELNEVIQILKNNGVIIFPTETVYGIGGNALSNEVIDKVYNAKNRPRAKAVNIMVSNKNEIKELLEEYEKNDNRIRLFLQPQNLGYNKNFEFLLQQSTANYIMFSDHDDVWHKDKVEKSLKLLKDKDFFSLSCNNLVFA